MKFTHTENIAILLLSDLALASNCHLTALSETAAKHGLSILFLKKVASSLKQHNLIKSKEGVNGGYKLALNPQNISIWDIFVSLNTVDESTSVLENNCCPLKKDCLPQNIKSAINLSIQKSLSQITLQNIIQGGKI
jgi:Rrf2 family protein